jgi:hypothetical protein
MVDIHNTAASTLNRGLGKVTPYSFLELLHRIRLIKNLTPDVGPLCEEKSTVLKSLQGKQSNVDYQVWVCL